MKRFVMNCMASGRITFASILLLLIASVGTFVAINGLAQKQAESTTGTGESVETPLSYSDKIEQLAAFSEHVFYIGDIPPDEEHSKQLYNLLNSIRIEPQGNFWASALERFIQQNPNSAWVPSLRANLAKHYYRTGSYSRALRHWETAWDVVKDLRIDPKNKQERLVKAQILGDWSRLLCRLGRVETLKELFLSVGDDPLDGAKYYVLFQRSLEATESMIVTPERGFRCGSLALYNVAQSLGVEIDRLKEIKAMDSPDVGFSIDELHELSIGLGLDLKPVFLNDKSNLIVPSVVHWKENHYAAIIDERDGEYLILDPTFRINKWVKKSIVSEESSGNFLVPNSKIGGKRINQLSKSEAKEIRGRGFPTGYDDDSDGLCPIEENADQVSTDGSNPLAAVDPNLGSGCGVDVDCYNTPEGGTGSGKPCDGGMPLWTVSQPYVNLWIRDTPVFYTQNNGKIRSFSVYYKQRNSRSSTYVYGFGPYWESNFLSYVDVLSGSDDVLYSQGGSIHEVDFTYGTSLYSNNAVPEETSTNVRTIKFPSGAENAYGDIGSGYGKKFSLGASGDRYFLGSTKDKQGRTTYYKYTEVSGYVHLTEVVDDDGNTTNFTYGTGSQAHLITQISTPRGGNATFTYDSNGYLKTITDSESMTTTFYYDSNGFVTQMTTPYGSTTFNLLRQEALTASNANDNRVNRCLIATYPNGSKEMWMYRNDSTYLNSDEIDYLIDDNDAPSTTPYSNDIDVSNTHAMNTFHWKPRQYSMLGTNFQSTLDFMDLEVKDYKRSHRKQWLHRDAGGADIVGGTINMERFPTEDATPSNTASDNDWGQSVWYDYVGKGSYNYEEGNQSLPLFVATKLENGNSLYTRYERDSKGRVKKEIEGWASGSSSDTKVVVEYEYESPLTHPRERLIKIKGPSGELLTEYVYNTKSQITDIKRFYGSGSHEYDQTEFTYHLLSGRLEEVEYPTGLKVDITYSGSVVTGYTYKNSSGGTIGSESFTYQDGKVRTHTDLRGLTRTYSHDNLGRLTEIDYPDGTDVKIQYNKLDVWKVTDRLGNLTENTHNNMGWLTHVKDANLDTTVYGYCDCGALDSVATPLGHTKDYKYYPNGRLWKIEYPGTGSPTIEYKYNKEGTVKEIYDGLVTVTNSYDNFGRMNKVDVPAGNLFHITQFSDDDLPEEIDAEGVHSSYTYDYFGRVKAKYVETDGVAGNGSNDSKLEWQYKDGYLEKLKFRETSSVTRTTTYTRDEFGRVETEHKDGVNQTTTYQYKSSGDLWKLTDPSNNTTEWDYDNEGRVIWKKDQTGTKILEFDWDANHNLTNRWTIAKGDTQYIYGAENELKNINYIGGGAPNVTYNYDDDGRLSSMVDGTGTTVYTYKSTGLLESEDGPYANDKITYGYNSSLRKDSLTLNMPSGGPWSASYTYDSSGRLEDVVSPAGTFTYGYTNVVTKVTATDYIDFPGSLKIDYGYHSQTRSLQDTWLKYGTTIKNHHHYKHNLAGWKTEHKLPNGVTSTLTHDAIGQLTKATNYNGNTYDYNYDDSWNLDYRKVNGTTEQFTTNTKNEMTQVPVPGSGTPGVPVYDSNGNMTHDGIDADYTYDAENRLKTAIWYDGTDYWKEEYFYDGFSRIRYSWKYKDAIPGLSIWSYVGGKLYIYDGMVLIQERDINNTTINATYTYGKDVSGSIHGAGGVGGILAGDLGGTTVFYHSDATGNITRLVNSSGSVLATYEYDPYGNITSQSGSLAATNRMRFSSKLYMDHGNYYYGYRFYSPYFQRWLNRDPINEDGGINLYGFAFNNSVDMIDAYGNMPEWMADFIISADPIVTPMAEGFTGFADNYTFGVSKLARNHLIGYDDGDLKCSMAYRIGDGIATAAGFATGAGAIRHGFKTRIAGKVADSTQWSHMIAAKIWRNPGKYLKPGSWQYKFVTNKYIRKFELTNFNGNLVSTLRHQKGDPDAYRFLNKKLKEVIHMYPKGLQHLDRVSATLASSIYNSALSVKNAIGWKRHFPNCP